MNNINLENFLEESGLIKEDLEDLDIGRTVFNAYNFIKEYGLKSKDSLTSILSASESIFAVAGEKMFIFDDINVANIISSNEFDFDILGKEQTAIFLIVPDEDKTYYSLK